MNKIKYHLPGAFEFFNFYYDFVPLFNNAREKFYDFVDIYCIYGCPKFFRWEGGRGGLSIDKYADYKQIKKFFESYNIGVSIAATNLLLTESDLYDKYCNDVVEYYNSPGNSIIVSNELLHKYIRENYKNYLLISSTTKCLNAEETIKEYDNDYDYVVLDYNLNNDWDFLNSLNDKQKNKTEFLVNHACGIKCPNRKNHYINISYSNLYGYGKHDKFFKNCIWQQISYVDSIKRPYIITIDRIINEYMNKGFSHFKIEGRNGSEIDLIFFIVNYFVKPEYHEEILYYLILNYLSYKNIS